MPAPKIIIWLIENRGIKVGEAIVRRAWNLANPDAVKQAVYERVAPTGRAKYRHLPAETIHLIKSMLFGGQAVRYIAEQVGCGISTVYRVKRAQQT